MILALLWLAQTLVRPDQIVNPQQVRPGAGDIRQTTLVNTRQISDGRLLDSDGRVCITVWIGFCLQESPEAIQVRRLQSCFTSEGVAGLHALPDWDVWLKAHGK